MIEGITEEIEVLRKTINCQGAEEMVDKSVEEMAALTRALIRFRYAERDYEFGIIADAIADKMAAVEIMMEVLRMIYHNNKDVEKAREEFLDELIKKLEKEGADGV